MTRAADTSIRCVATLELIGSTPLVRLTDAASRALPSRGQVAALASLHGHGFRTVIEPDGLRGHWVRVEDELRRAAGLDVGDEVEVVVEVVKDWPEPNLPADLAAALSAAAPEIGEAWDDITPMARWEWVRWVNATANPATRRRRVEVGISKLAGGKRRPCCFDLSACTDPALARSGKLRITP
jgi:hypothetical protein